MSQDKTPKPGTDKGARPISVENHEPSEKAHKPEKHYEKGADPIVRENDESGRGGQTGR